MPSFATHLDAPVAVPGLGELRVDLAYGGAFCAFVDAEALGYAIVPDEARELAELGERIRPAVAEQLEVAHPLEPALSALSFVVFTAAPRAGGDARNATVVAPGRLDRSATGTATSARMAVLAARGLIGDDEEFVNESVIGTRFVGRIVAPHAGRRRRRRSCPRSPAGRGSPASTSSCSTPTTRSRRGSAAGHLGRRAVRLRVLARADVEAALDLDALVEELAAAFAALSAGEASMPPRVGVDGAGRGLDPADGRPSPRRPAVGVKLVSIYPGHDPAHQAAIVVFDAATGTPTALMDGDAITAARTAAGSRLATRLLAREDADVLAVIGTGVQGEAHLEALRREREWAEVRVWGRRGSTSVEEAVRGAGVDLRRHPGHRAGPAPRVARPGAHVNSVGFTTQGGELDPALVRDALVAVESRESALAPPPAGSTDLEGVRDAVELGELVAGTDRAAPTRSS